MKRDLNALIHLLAPAPYSDGDQMQRALEGLSARERSVLEYRFGLKDGKNHSLEAVGAVFGVTGERIRQIEARALGKLRRAARLKQEGGSVPLVFSMAGSIAARHTKN